eukprot:gene33900-41017_t
MKRSKKCFNLVELDYDLDSKRVRINEFSAEFSQLRFTDIHGVDSDADVNETNDTYLTLESSRPTSLDGAMGNKRSENFLKRSLETACSEDSLHEDCDCNTAGTRTTHATSFGTLSLSRASLQPTEADDSEGDDLGKAQFQFGGQFPEDGALSDSEFSAGL